MSKREERGEVKAKSGGGGYCQPPKAHQWKKGMPSPNPYGRPPKKAKQSLLATMDPMAAAFLEHDKRTLTKREGDSIQTIERGMAAVEALFKQGMEGNPRALKAYLDIREKAYAEERKVNEQVIGAAIEWQEKWGPRFEAAEKRGDFPPAVLPHPKDVVITPDGEIEIVGPVTWQHQKELEDALEHRRKLEEVLAKFEVFDCEVDVDSYDQYVLAWVVANDGMPPRLRKSSHLEPDPPKPRIRKVKSVKATEHTEEPKRLGHPGEEEERRSLI